MPTPSWSAKLSLTYLALLPTLGTIGMAMTIPAEHQLVYKGALWVSMWIFSLVALAVYLGATLTYTKISSNPLLNILGIIDTPLLTWLSGKSLPQTLATVFVVETLALLLGLLLVIATGRNRQLKSDERLVTSVIFLTPAVFTLIVTGWYLNATGQTSPTALAIIAGLTLQASWLNHQNIAKDEPGNPFEMMPYLLIGIMSWTLTYFILTMFFQN